MLEKRVTVEELEQMLKEPDGKYNIEVQPDGSIRAVEGKPNHATPKIRTLKQVLGDGY